MILTTAALALGLTGQEPDAVSVRMVRAVDGQVRVAFSNRGSEPICLALNNGARLFDFRRNGRSLPFPGGLPSAPPPACFRLRPHEQRSVEFDLRIAFPDIRPGDEACFEVWSRPLNVEAHSQQWTCHFLE